MTENVRTVMGESVVLFQQAFLVFVVALSFFLLGYETFLPGYSADQQIVDHAQTLSFHWVRNLPLESFGTDVQTIGGTEARALAAMNKTLYAGIGYWMDSQAKNPSLPGAQILRLDSPDSTWKVDLQLDERLKKGPRAGMRRYLAIAVLKTVTLDSDHSGKKLSKPVEFVLAGVWDLLGDLEVYSKQAQADRWTKSNLGHEGGRYAEIRSFGSHRDKVTNVQRVFAGARVNGLSIPSQIYSGVYDASAAGHIRWDDNPEQWQGDLSLLAKTTRSSCRITSFAECNGNLYATVYNTIYERQDGERPGWKPVWTCNPEVPFGEGSSGLRGLTAIRNPEGPGEILLVSAEHKPGLIFHVDPHTWKDTLEINTSAYLTKQFGYRVGYADAGYNDMLSYEPINRSGKPVILMGIEAAAPKLPHAFGPWVPDAYYLIRWPNGQYSVQEIVDKSLSPKPILVSVRSLICSPFPSDPPGTIYAAGFDCNGINVHNSAWIYRGTPVLARQ